MNVGLLKLVYFHEDYWPKKRAKKWSAQKELGCTRCHWPSSRAAEEEEEVGQSFRTRHFVQEEQPTLGIGMTKLHFTRLKLQLLGQWCDRENFWDKAFYPRAANIWDVASGWLLTPVTGSTTLYLENFWDKALCRRATNTSDQIGHRPFCLVFGQFPWTKTSSKMCKLKSWNIEDLQHHWKNQQNMSVWVKGPKTPQLIELPIACMYELGKKQNCELFSVAWNC